MKNYYALTITLSILFFACKKDEPISEPVDYNTKHYAKGRIELPDGRIDSFYYTNTNWLSQPRFYVDNYLHPIIGGDGQTHNLRLTATRIWAESATALHYPYTFSIQIMGDTLAPGTTNEPWSREDLLAFFQEGRIFSLGQAANCALFALNKKELWGQSQDKVSNQEHPGFVKVEKVAQAYVGTAEEYYTYPALKITFSFEGTVGQDILIKNGEAALMFKYK